MAIELKKPGAYTHPEKGLSEVQRQFLSTLEQHDAVVIVADCWEKIQETLDEKFPPKQFPQSTEKYDDGSYTEKTQTKS
ncbi:MAG: hypothetical protein ACREQ5_14080 [Candidatus Dormibacteria bacterium]